MSDGYPTLISQGYPKILWIPSLVSHSYPKVISQGYHRRGKFIFSMYLCRPYLFVDLNSIFKISLF